MNRRIPGLVAAVAVGAALFLWATHLPAQEHSMTSHKAQAGGHAGMNHEMAPGHSHEQCELHGGQVSMTTAHHVETVASPDGIRVYLYSMDQQPLPADDVAGTVTLKAKSGKSQELKLTPFTPKEDEPAVYYCTMHDSPATTKPGNCAVCGMKLVPQSGLVASADLKGLEPGKAEAIVHLTGLGGDEKELTVTTKLRPQGAPKAPAGEPAHEHGMMKGK